MGFFDVFFRWVFPMGFSDVFFRCFFTSNPGQFSVADTVPQEFKLPLSACVSVNFNTFTVSPRVCIIGIVLNCSFFSTIGNFSI